VLAVTGTQEDYPWVPLIEAFRHCPELRSIKLKSRLDRECVAAFVKALSEGWFEALRELDLHKDLGCDMRDRSSQPSGMSYSYMLHEIYFPSREGTPSDYGSYLCGQSYKVALVVGGG